MNGKLKSTTVVHESQKPLPQLHSSKTRLGHLFPAWWMITNHPKPCTTIVQSLLLLLMVPQCNSLQTWQHKQNKNKPRISKALTALLPRGSALSSLVSFSVMLQCCRLLYRAGTSNRVCSNVGPDVLTPVTLSASPCSDKANKAAESQALYYRLANIYPKESQNHGTLLGMGSQAKKAAEDLGSCGV